jgi:hypothetical protein
MRSPFDRLPASWKVPATVIRGGGRDDWGELEPEERIDRPKGVLIGKGTTVEANAASSLVDTTLSLYDGDPSFEYRATDKIEVPEGSRNAGTWAVSGKPFQWPYGSEVPLDRA